MLKRIKEISGVGSYISCKSPAAELRELTLIYGSNSYGKSTLCDILRTLESSSSDVTPITERQSIPASVAQTISLTMSDDGQSEKPLRFQSGSWVESVPYGFKYAVFDSGFISRNLFTGQDIDRRNKEALTQFVLGEQGVIQAAEIANDNKTQAQKKNELKIIEKGFNGISNIQAFINTQISESEVSIETAIVQLNVSIDQKQKQIINTNNIAARPAMANCGYVPIAADKIDELNTLFKISLQTVDDEARSKLQHHITTHMQGHAEAQQWIRQGLDLVTGNDCPFCAQPLGDAASTLLDLYRKSFNDTFKEKFSELNEKMTQAYELLQKYSGITYNSIIQDNLRAIQLYPELGDEELFKPLPIELEDVAAKLNKAVDTYGEAWGNIHGPLFQTILNKRNVPHDELVGVDSGPLRLAEQALINATAQYAVVIEKINAEFSKFKQEVGIAKLQSEINAHNLELLGLSSKKRRLQMNVACEEHKALSIQIAELDKKIKKSQDDLSQQQSSFLEKFFEKINHYFVKFGSRDFTIGTDTTFDAKGHQPVISLIVKFKEKKIPTSQLVRVFSESDRRAFALSIFWARLSIMSDDEKKKTILIFDDPVTSFDDNRISVTMMELKSALDKFRQAVFLTHYPRLVQHMLVNMKLAGSMALLKLNKDVSGTTLSVASEGDFVETEHHRKFKKIKNFIDGARDKEIDSDLRVFLETEIHERYRQVIFDRGLDKLQLGELITALGAASELSQEVEKKLHLLRENLNGPHHTWSSRSLEDWASLAEETLSVIYREL
jgi:wobble nucleotide-excising tRNase